MTPATATTPDLAQVLVRLARERALAVEHLRAEQLLADAENAFPGEEPDRWAEWLSEAAASLTLRARVARLSLAEAVQLAEDGALLVGGYREATGPLILAGASGGKVELATGEIDARDRISIAKLAEFIGAGEGDTRRWLIVEHPELPNTADSSSPGALAAGHEPQNPIQRLLALLRPEGPDMWVIVVFAFFAGILSLATPLAVEALVNTVAFGRVLQPVLVLAILLFGFLVFASAMQAAQTFVVEIIQRRLFARVAADLAYRLPRVRTSALTNYHGPELVNRFFDVVTLQKVTASLLLDGIRIVLATLVGMTVLAFYHPWLLGFDIFLLLITVGGLLLLGRGGVATGIDESHLKYRLAAWLEDILRCPLGFKTGGGADFAMDRANHITASYLQHRRDHFRVLFRQYLFILSLQAIAGTVLLGFGGWLVIRGQLTLGQLVAAELIVATILGSLAKLGKHIEGFYDLVAGVDKLGKLFDLGVERPDGLLGIPQGEGVRVRFTDVTLQDRGPALETGLSLSLDAGEKVALLGPSASGKSSVLNLLYGLHSPSSGHLEIEHCDPRDLRPDILRSHVALVRGVELFEGTVAENIDLRRPGVDMNDVRKALFEVGLLDEILRMPDGLATKLNASGRPLSSTQQSLLMIARALVGRPRLLLLDGVLDGLPDEDRQRIQTLLTDKSAKYTVMIATGRQLVASQLPRTIDLEREFESPSSLSSDDSDDGGTA